MKRTQFIQCVNCGFLEVGIYSEPYHTTTSSFNVLELSVVPSNGR